ncbi:MAG: hypothetical protein IPO07_02800 [Haliscomenobacter sp.]|nr:hypothetical protein [Haliscomenobacter sp.]MBK9487825.1 hypothetical protein [Haliscomenobacter sp.]
MKISADLKQLAYKTANRVIEKFRNKELKGNDEELIVIEATMIKVGIDKSHSIIEEHNKANKNEGIELTEDFILFMVCKNNHLFSRIYNRYKTDRFLEDIPLDLIIEDWKETKNQVSGIEKYFNTEDEHFNNNAYYWYIHLKDKKLFPDIEVPFMILSEYLHFLRNFNIPISCVDKLKNKMDEHKLNKEQKLFIFDKINGLIANADIETQNNLSHINIEVLDSRWNIEPYQDLNYEQYSIEYIVEEASKIEDFFERLRFFKHRKLEYEKEAQELGWDIGLGNEIQVEIEVLEKLIASSNINHKSGKSTEELLGKVQGFIKNGQTLKAIEYLLDEDKIAIESIKFGFLQLSGQWKENEWKVNLGLVNDTEAGQTRNRITNAVLNLAKEIEK